MKPKRATPWALLPCLAALITVSGPPRLLAQNPTAQIKFHYENPKLQPPEYVITVEENGNGHFVSQGVSTSPPDSENVAAGPQDQPIHISQGLRTELFTVARKNKLFNVRCEDPSKNIAFQGTKTIAYQGPEGQGTCTYNWSRIAQIDKLTDQLQALAATIEEGGKLQRQYEHGRLSLDAELEFLTQMVADGRAAEIENIAPILRTIAADDAVLKRVQRRAQALLQAAPAN